MLKDHYMPYSNSVMVMLRSLLEEYNIDYTKDDVIDLLIEQAESERENCDYIKPLIRPFKVMVGLIIPIAAYIGKKLIDDAEMIEALKFSLLIIFIIIVLFAAVIAFAPLVKEMNPNYIKYTEFIYNLKQLKIFKENKDK